MLGSFVCKAEKMHLSIDILVNFEYDSIHLVFEVPSFILMQVYQYKEFRLNGDQETLDDDFDGIWLRTFLRPLSPSDANQL